MVGKAAGSPAGTTRHENRGTWSQPCGGEGLWPAKRMCGALSPLLGEARPPGDPPGRPCQDFGVTLLSPSPVRQVETSQGVQVMPHKEKECCAFLKNHDLSCPPFYVCLPAPVWTPT